MSFEGQVLLCFTSLILVESVKWLNLVQCAAHTHTHTHTHTHMRRPKIFRLWTGITFCRKCTVRRHCLLAGL